MRIPFTEMEHLVIAEFQDIIKAIGVKDRSIGMWGSGKRWCILHVNWYENRVPCFDRNMNESRTWFLDVEHRVNTQETLNKCVFPDNSLGKFVIDDSEVLFGPLLMVPHERPLAVFGWQFIALLQQIFLHRSQHGWHIGTDSDVVITSIRVLIICPRNHEHAIWSQ